MPNTIDDLSVLIIGYRRISNLKEIVESCIRNGISKIYVTVDGPRFNSPFTYRDQTNIKNHLVAIEKSHGIHIPQRFGATNRGISVSILAGLDWVFSLESFVAVIEDDCIPEDDFFTFLRDCCSILNDDNSVWFACGTQFAPQVYIQDSWSLSSYFSSWGWATTRSKWHVIRNSLIEAPNIRAGLKNSWENIYWNEGARRVQQGFNDAWDIAFNQVLRAKGRYVLAPSVPLISNVGNDALATNMDKKSRGLNLVTATYEAPRDLPVLQPNVDRWIRKNIYRISPRHLITTKVTRFRDMLSANKIPHVALKDRWFDAIAQDS